MAGRDARAGRQADPGRNVSFRARRRRSLPGPLRAVREGLPYSYFESLGDAFGIPARELALVAGIPERTLARRKTEGAFSPEESDRLARVRRIADLAREVLGDAARASEWLRHANTALGGQTPLRWLDTDLGSREVEDVLGRIGHGLTG